MTNTYKQEIARIQQQIVEKFDPIKIILFGSLARGDVGQDSDIDLLIVQESYNDRITITNEYYKRIDYNIPTDFVITTSQGFIDGNKDPSNTFAKDIMREGILLYER